MITENLLLQSSSFFIIILVLQTSLATKMDPHCSPSSCGTIRNISFPFRLKVDPEHCGHPDYELDCENNVTTFLYIHSQKFNVKAINYNNFTIRLADVSIKNNTCSFPNHSLTSNNFSYGYPYSTGSYLYLGLIPEQDFPNAALPINFMSCPDPLKNSSFFTETGDCASNSSNRRHTYIQAGHMNASDVSHMCRIDMFAMTSWKFDGLKNVSISEIHDSLLYGFELSWYRYECSKCKDTSVCFVDAVDHTAVCDVHILIWSLAALLVVIPVLLVILSVLVCGCVGVSIPAKIIIGFACAFCGLLYLTRLTWTYHNIIIARSIMWLLEIIELTLIVRFVIGFPCLMGYLIYKFRRRHMSAFAAIEKFLQNDDKIKPIRYSYSNIKKMTKGFREKLGQGGYGTVYKGRLRSGRDVAVKLLENANKNDQDFINEISTIGRIHHVNVVRLVGYCAVGTKRALVYDFMPNGSLDKYLFSRENMNSLSWERKYEIAVGVARGIDYLHKGCDIQILHFDIKPHNILLDDNFTPKISDFGLAKFFSTEKSTVTMTAARGTIGYVAPELINRGFGRVSYKADVYSFGMLLIEMVGLKRDLRGNDQTSSQYFPCWIYDYIEQGKDIEFGIIDENNDDNISDAYRKIAKKMTLVALWCIQTSPDDRPSMNKVVEMLEAQVERLLAPNRPPESSPVAVNYEDQSLTTYSTDSASEITVVNV